MLFCSAAWRIFPEQGWKLCPRIGRWILYPWTTRKAPRTFKSILLITRHTVIVQIMILVPTFKLLIKLYQPHLYPWPANFNHFMEWSDSERQLWKQSGICLNDSRFPGREANGDWTGDLASTNSLCGIISDLMKKISLEKVELHRQKQGEKSMYDWDQILGFQRRQSLCKFLSCWGWKLCRKFCLCTCARLVKSCRTLGNPMGCRLPGSYAHGIL